MKKKFLTKKHMAVLLSAALAAGSLSFMPTGYRDLSVVYAEEPDSNTDEEGPKFEGIENGELTLITGADKTLTITGLEEGSTVTFKSDNKKSVAFVKSEAETNDEEDDNTDSYAPELEENATEASVKVKAGFAGEANITAEITNAGASETMVLDDGESPACKITVEFKLDGLDEDGNLSLDLKDSEPKTITVIGVEDGTELDWTPTLSAGGNEPGSEEGNKPEEGDDQGSEEDGKEDGGQTKTQDDQANNEDDGNGTGDDDQKPGNDNDGDGKDDGETSAPTKPEDIATVVPTENKTTEATITAKGVGEINVTVAIKEVPEEGSEGSGGDSDAETESLVAKENENGADAPAAWKTQNFVVKVTDGEPGSVVVNSIELDEESITLKKRESKKLTATVDPEGAAVTWESDDEEVAKVAEDGTVTAEGKGKTTITAKAGDKTATCEVTVTEEDTTVAVTGITLDKTSVSLNKGEKVTLKATVAPANATNPAVTWSTSDAKVATVANGTVTAVEKGTATITAKAGDKTATCTVTVNVPNTTVAVTGITLDQTSLTLEKGKTATLKATVAPANATNPAVTWSTSDAKVATVANGTVTAVEKGTATITAKAGDKTATCTVTVNAPKTKVTVPAKKVTLNTKQIYLVKGKSVNVKATVTPSNTTDKVTWSTSNKKVATVKNGKISAKKAGKATITAKAGSKKATVKVNVVSKATKSTKVTLNKKKATLKVKKTLTLKATMKPAKSTDTLKWSSSNKKVAKVDNYGVVTAVKKGKATITVKTSSGKKATCTITVK